MTDVLTPGVCVMLLRCIQAGGPYNPLTDPAWDNKSVAETLAKKVIRSGFADFQDGRMKAKPITREEYEDVRARADESPLRESVLGPRTKRKPYPHWGMKR